MMTQRTWFALGLLAVGMLSYARTLLGADTRPATEPATAEPLPIVVVAVQGHAQVKLGRELPWQPALAGTVLSVGCQIRTGVPGAVQFTIGTDHIYRVDRLSLVQVVEADQSQGRIKTIVGMTYGRVSKEVDTPVLPHDDQIVSPSSTLATRGTQVSLYDQPPYVPEAISLTGPALFSTVGRQLVAFGAKGQGTAEVNADDPDPAGFALASQIVDPSIAAARTAAEQKLLADVITQGAVITFPNANAVPIVRDTGEPSNAELPALATGALTFILRWNTNTNTKSEMPEDCLARCAQAAAKRNKGSQISSKILSLPPHCVVSAA